MTTSPDRVDQISVVAGTAEHRVVAAAAIQRIVARAADQPIVAIAAVERIVASVAGDCVVEGIARAADAGRSGEGQVFNVVAEREIDTALDRVGSLTRELSHDIAYRIDHVGVVAHATEHRVIASCRHSVYRCRLLRRAYHYRRRR